MRKSNSEEYITILKDRGKKSRVYRKYQLTGLLIAELLDDEKHKSLYIKLAKEKNQQKLLALAKDVAERKNVKKKGGYFMRMLFTKPTPIAERSSLRGTAQNLTRNRRRTK